MGHEEGEFQERVCGHEASLAGPSDNSSISIETKTSEPLAAFTVRS